MIADSHGVIILSGKSEWQFATQRALRPAEKAEIEASRQFEGKSLQRLPFDPSRADVLIDGRPYRFVASPVGLTGGDLIVLMPTQRALEGSRAQARIIVVLILFILLAILA
jgi:C4-dicarboxylate-specific signal transduction histidine kinase